MAETPLTTLQAFEILLNMQERREIDLAGNTKRMLKTYVELEKERERDISRSTPNP